MALYSIFNVESGTKGFILLIRPIAAPTFEQMWSISLPLDSCLSIHVYYKTRKFIDSSNRSVTYRDIEDTYFVFEIIGRSNEQIFWVFLMNLKFVTYHPFPDVIKKF